MILDKCKSTNDEAKKMAHEGKPVGTWVSARIQTHGKGRRGREWISLDGNLFLSVLVETPKQATWLPLAAGISVCRELEQIFGEDRVQLKWPNDLILEGKKLGGLLCEVVPNTGLTVVGIGLNVQQAPANENAVSLSEIFEPARKTGFLDLLCVRLAQTIGRATVESVGGLRSDFIKRSGIPVGSEITWAEGKETGTLLGVGEQGELQVETNLGLRRLYSEDVTVRAARVTSC